MPGNWFWNNSKSERLVCFVGAGGTGKTVVLNGVKEHLEKIGIDHFYFPSITREFYALMGVADEKAYLDMQPQDKWDFQLKLLKYFVEKTDKVLKENPGKPIITDRTFFDHMSYAVFSVVESADILTLETYREYLRPLAMEYAQNVALMTYFPYPASFSKNKDPDNFRFAPPAKNITIGALMHHHILDEELNPKRFIYLAANSTPDVRTKMIINELIDKGFLQQERE